ncbi:MAG: alpha/beta fold hydrolase [Solirubrobacteraceae bacterium]
MELNHHRVGAGEPLVLIHGIGSRWQIWEPVIDSLSSRHDVIALDLPGFGASPAPPPGTPPGSESLATLVAGFLDELGIDRAHLAGNSLGGLVALRLGLRGRALTVAGVSPSGFASRAELAWTRASLWASVRASRALAPRADALMASSLVRRLGLGLFMVHAERMPPAEAAANLRALAAAPWFDATLASFRPLELSGGERLTVPVTIAWGQHDRVLVPRQARRAARAIPAARVLTLRGCGHVPTYDDPEQVARVLLDAAAA